MEEVSKRKAVRQSLSLTAAESWPGVRVYQKHRTPVSITARLSQSGGSNGDVTLLMEVWQRDTINVTCNSNSEDTILLSFGQTNDAVQNMTEMTTTCADTQRRKRVCCLENQGIHFHLPRLLH